MKSIVKHTSTFSYELPSPTLATTVVPAQIGSGAA